MKKIILPAICSCILLIACMPPAPIIKKDKKDDKNKPILHGKSLDEGCYDLSMYSDGNNIFISYYNNEGNNLKLAKSSDKGINWVISTIDSITNAEYNITYGTNINSYNNNIEILYNLITYSGNYTKYANSADSGQNWNISTLNNKYCENVAYCRENSNMYIAGAFWGQGSVRHNIGFYKSLDNGTSWNSSIADNSYDVDCPSINTSNGNVYLAYCDFGHGNGYNLKFAKSVDQGSNWLLKSIDPEKGAGYLPSITSLNNEIYISYMGNNSLNFAESPDYGETWNTKILENSEVWSPKIISSGNELLIVYRVWDTHTLKIKRSIDNGQNWTTSTICYAPYPYDGYQKPVIYKNGNDIFIACLFWNNAKGYVTFIQSNDNGLTWK